MIGALIGAIFYGLLIYIVGKLNWGIEVDGYGPAFLAAIIIAILGAVAHFIWSLLGYELPSGLSGAIINAIITAGFLLFAGDRVAGLRVKGFSGALIAALAIGAVQYVIGLLLVSIIL